MIIFKQVKIKNFLSYGDNPTVIQLDRSPTTIVMAPNGAGKSTIISSISFALFGRSIHEVKKAGLINTINQGNCVVELTFQKGKDLITIKRGMKPNILDITINGNIQDEKASAKESQKHIENHILGFDFNAFSRVCSMSTMNYTPFLSLPAQQRRDFVETLLDIKIFSAMNKLHKQDMANLKTDITEASNQLSVLDVQKSEKEKLLDYIKTNYDDEINSFSNQLSNMLKSHDATKHAITIKKSELPTLKKAVDKYNTVLDECRAQSEKINLKFSKQQAIIERNNKTVDYISNHDSCELCKQNITDDHSNEIIKTATNENSKASDEIAILQGQLDTIKQIANEAKEKQIKATIALTQANNDIVKLQSELSNKINAMKSLATHIDSLKTKSSVSKSDVVNDLSGMNKQIQSAKAVFNEKSEELKLSSVILELLKDDGIKSDIIKKYIPILVASTNKYLAQLGLPLKFDMDENFNESIITRYSNEFTYHNLSAGERARIDLSLAFAWREVAKRKGSVDTNLLMLDEILDATLDESGTLAALEIVNELANEGNNIFIVSHKANLEEYVRSTMKLEKVNGFTQIIQ